MVVLVCVVGPAGEKYTACNRLVVGLVVWWFEVHLGQCARQVQILICSVHFVRRVQSSVVARIRCIIILLLVDTAGYGQVLKAIARRLVPMLAAR